LHLEKKSFVIRDLSSRNGTWVNGLAAPRHPLSSGDQILLGTTTLTFSLPGGSLAAARAAPEVILSVGEEANDHGPVTFFIQNGACEDKSRLRQLYDIATTLTATLDREALLTCILDQVMKTLPVERAFLALQEDSGGELQFLQVQATPGSTSEPIRVSRSIIDQVTREGKAILLHDALDDPRFRKAKSVVRYMLRSVACAPLKCGDKILGVLYIDNRSQAGSFAPGDLSFLVALGQLSAIALNNAQLYREVRERGQRLELELRRRRRLLACSGVMRQIQKMLAQVAATDVPILISGESGTGKELVARELHALSRQASGPFLAVNCATIPESMAESELFGVCRGVATGVNERPGLFERAQGGTLFLDEIGEMPLGQQAKLLRILEERRVARVGATSRCACREKGQAADHTQIPLNVRIVTATNRDLEQFMAEKRFRTDLFYRLNIFPIKIPPLRERPEDIPLLATFIFDEECQNLGKPLERISYPAMKRLRNLSWSGSNVRQLRSELQRAIILCDGNFLQPGDFLPEGESSPAAAGKTLKEAMKRHILQVLGECQGNKTRAAAMLGISPGTLYNKLHEYGEGKEESIKNEEWAATD